MKGQKDLYTEAAKFAIAGYGSFGSPLCLDWDYGTFVNASCEFLYTVMSHFPSISVRTVRLAQLTPLVIEDRFMKTGFVSWDLRLASTRPNISRLASITCDVQNGELIKPGYFNTQQGETLPLTEAFLQNYVNYGIRERV